MMLQTKILGNNGESLVADWLTKHGAKILARNYQARVGEIDIIAVKDDVVAFVEVKTRNTNYIPLAQTVTLSKQKRLIKTAQKYILANQIRDKVIRFDIATVLWIEGKEYSISYIKNAFGPL